MRAFVTGIGGFVGRHLLRHLEDEGDEVAGLVKDLADLPAGARGFAGDVRSASDLAGALAGQRTQAVYHLAGVSSVAQSWSQRRETLETNVLGTEAVLEAARRLDPPPRVLLVGSSDEYGRVEGSGPIDESVPLRPLSPYGVSKAAAELLGMQAALAEGLPVVCVRAFNHTGPGQSAAFVIPEWARAVAEIERGARKPLLEVGNVDVVRDFSDVRDIVRLYRLLVVKGRPGEVYNACSGQGRTLRSVLVALQALARTPFEVEKRAGQRPGDAATLVGSRAKATGETGWEPGIPFEQTLADVLEDWRSRS